MESTEVSEKRFEGAMERLFSGCPTPAVSSAGVKKEEFRQNMSGRALQTAGVSAPLSESHGCRPWDRGDLLRRLGTYKSISWFGKPQVAGPVACARRGWVNVDVDLLECEVCGSRLSFPVPLSWTRPQAERAALAFAEQLDTAHKGLCAWKGNPCAETLAHFPPTPLPVLRGAYTDRCEALLQLSALPVISEATKYQMKLSQGPQVDQLLSEPSPTVPEFLSGHEVGSSSSEDGSFPTNKAFYQAQRIIALCGWEPRLLSYTVDCEDWSAAQSIDEHTGKSWEPGPSVTVHNRGLDAEVAQSEINAPGRAVSDPASAVLVCNLCGASVGLWNFTTVDRPAPLFVSGLEELLAPNKKSLESGSARISAAASVDGLGLARPDAAETPSVKAPEAVAVNLMEKAASQKGVLDLKLTIAGGPPPTRLSAPAMVSPAFGIPGLQHTGMQSKRSETGTYAAASYESLRPGHQERGTGHQGSTLVTIAYDRPLPADSVEGKVVDDREVEDVEDSKDAGHSSKRKREDILGEQEAEGGQSSRIAKCKREVSSQWPGSPKKRPARDLPHASSVNAIVTCYPQMQGNSMESVDNEPQDSNGQGTTTAEGHGNGPESVVQAEYSMCHNGIEADKSRSEEGAGTNIIVISTGTMTEVSAGLGGGRSVGIGESHEVEIQGVGDNLECMESVAEFVTDVTGLMEEFVPGRGLMDEFVSEGTVKVDVKDNHGDSQGAMLDVGHTFVKDTRSAGASKRSQGKGSLREADKNANAGSTFDTTNAVIQGHDVGANLQVKDVTHGHMAGESPLKRNEVVQTREFDPIRQHRHFCPWINGRVAAATSNTGTGVLCGWQITLDALQREYFVPGFSKSESAASKYKVIRCPGHK